MKKKYRFTFECQLVNKKVLEEKFKFAITSTSLVLAKDEMDQALHVWFGSITKRVYKNQHMHSERYWSVELIEVLAQHQDDEK